MTSGSYPDTCYYTSFLSLSGCQHTGRLAINWLDYVIKNSSGIYDSNHWGKLIAFYVPKPSLQTPLDIHTETLSKNAGLPPTHPSQKHPLAKGVRVFYHWGMFSGYHLKEANPRDVLALALGWSKAISKRKKRHQPGHCSNQNIPPTF